MPSLPRALAAAVLLVLLIDIVVALPERSCDPHPQISPFILFHQRKTGGSSLRQEIFQSSQQRGFTAYVPCLNADCWAVAQRDWQQQVLAGHFSWNYVHGGRSAWMLRACPPTRITCLTVFRDQLERLRSCFYFSLRGQVANNTQWSDLSPRQMRTLLTGTHLGQLCTNEPIRLFSGLEGDDVIAQLEQHPDLTAVVVELAREHLSQCVGLMQEDLRKPITRDILNYWVPWLNHTDVEVNVTPDKPPTEALSTAQEAALKAVVGAERKLYEVARQQYQAQVAHIQTMRGTPTPC